MASSAEGVGTSLETVNVLGSGSEFATIWTRHSSRVGGTVSVLINKGRLLSKIQILGTYETLLYNFHMGVYLWLTCSTTVSSKIDRAVTRFTISLAQAQRTLHIGIHLHVITIKVLSMISHNIV